MRLLTEVNDFIFHVISHKCQSVVKYTGSAVRCWCIPLESNALTSARVSNVCDREHLAWATSCSVDHLIRLFTFVWVETSDIERVILVKNQSLHHLGEYLWLVSAVMDNAHLVIALSLRVKLEASQRNTTSLN
jgi:hypothetical protein